MVFYHHYTLAPTISVGDGIVHTTSNCRAIWSSACGVSCSVNSGNKRNPCFVLQVSQGTAPIYGEEGGDDAKSAWPSDALGNTGATMAGTKGC